MAKKCIIATVLFVLLIVSFIPLDSASAYLWSPTYNVKINLSFKPKTGLQNINAVDCTSATMTVGGVTYTATVTNPWLSNSCSLTFSKVKVSSNGNYTVKVGYTAYFMNSSKTFSTFLSRPIGATLTKSYTIYY